VPTYEIHTEVLPSNTSKSDFIIFLKVLVHDFCSQIRKHFESKDNINSQGEDSHIEISQTNKQIKSYPVNKLAYDS
jgi:hypothetical protein